jgi:hypothetical protein
MEISETHRERETTQGMRKRTTSRIRRVAGVMIPILGLLIGSSVGTSSALADHVLSVDAKGGFGGPNGLIPLDATFGGQQLGVWSGIQTAQLDGGKAFDAYCVDFYHDNYVPNQYDVQIKDIRDLNSPSMGGGPTGGNGAGVAYLYDKNAAAASTDHWKAAGLQAAIWSVEYGQGFKVTDAPSTDGYSGSDQARATYWMNQFLKDYQEHGLHSDFDATWYQAEHVGNLFQDLVGPSREHGDFRPTPEPSSLLMAGMGAGIGLIALVRKRRQKV